MRTMGRAAASASKESRKRLAFGSDTSDNYDIAWSLHRRSKHIEKEYLKEKETLA